jgi:hypothetical protein
MDTYFNYWAFVGAFGSHRWFLELTGYMTLLVRFYKRGKSQDCLPAQQ